MPPSILLLEKEIVKRFDNGFDQNIISWKNASLYDINSYKSNLDMNLKTLSIPWDAIHCNDYMCNSHTNDLCSFYLGNIDAFLLAGYNCIPNKCYSNDRKKHPGWTTHVENKRQKAILWHKIWKSNNSPSHGLLYDIKHNSRKEYHKAIKFIKRNKNKISAEKLGESLINGNSKQFWNTVKKVKGHCNKLASNIDGVVDEKGICEIFCEQYKSLYTSVSYNDREMSEIICETIKAITNKCKTGNCYWSHKINVEDISLAIKCLKSGKSDGFNQTMSDYIINSTSKASIYLSLVLNSLLIHGVAPEEMCIGTIIPIPKDKRKSICDSNNYRGITLSSCIGKVLDHVLLNCNRKAFSTSNLQFGFKTNHSTFQCTFDVNEIIQYYLNKKKLLPILLCLMLQKLLIECIMLNYLSYC